MAFLGYKDLFKQATDKASDPVYYTRIDAGSDATNYPISNAQKRQLGFKWRRYLSGTVMQFSVTSNNAIAATDTQYMTQIVGILGHNLPDGTGIDALFDLRLSSSVLITYSINSSENGKFNSDYIYFRDYESLVPYKVTITITVPGAYSGSYIDIGRVWVGPGWDLNNPNADASNFNLMEGWKLGMTKGANSKRTIGNQSFNNRTKALKTVDFKLRTYGDTETIGAGLLGLDSTNCLLGFIDEMESGGECIIAPRDYMIAPSFSNQAKLWQNRVTVYGESNASSHEIKHINGNNFEADFKIIEVI